MRTLFAVVIAAAVLTGCSDGPDASDLTEEQLAALQVLGEIVTPDPGHERYKAARQTVHARNQVYEDIMDTCKAGSDERWKALSFVSASNNVCLEYYRRAKIDGTEKAADWFIAEIKKSDDQIIEDWCSPECRPPGPWYERYRAARKTLDTRRQVYIDLMNDFSKSGPLGDRTEEWWKACSFVSAAGHVRSEYDRRKEVDGSEKAADWFIAEIKKSDDQIIEEYGYDARHPG